MNPMGVFQDFFTNIAASAAWQGVMRLFGKRPKPQSTVLDVQGKVDGLIMRNNTVRGPMTFINVGKKGSIKNADINKNDIDLN